MKKIETTKYDVAEHLRTPEEMAAYLEACLEEANGDIKFIENALSNIGRAKGMSAALLSEDPLAADWLKNEEDKAWAHLQSNEN